MFIIIVRIKIQRVRKMQYFVYNNTEEKCIILPSLLPSLSDEIWPTISTGSPFHLHRVKQVERWLKQVERASLDKNVTCYLLNLNSLFTISIYIYIYIP